MKKAKKLGAVEQWKEINNKFSNLLFQLRERWSAEKEYEDFKDYVAALKKSIPNVISGRKSDFSFLIDCTDCNLRISVKATRTSLKIMLLKCEAK